MLKTKITKVDLKDLQKMSFDVGTETEFYFKIGKLRNVTLEEEPSLVLVLIVVEVSKLNDIYNSTEKENMVKWSNHLSAMYVIKSCSPREI